MNFTRLPLRGTCPQCELARLPLRGTSGQASRRASGQVTFP